MWKTSSSNETRAFTVILLSLLLFMEIQAYGIGRRMNFRPLQDSGILLNDVSALYQDSEGYVWIVTYSALVRYDGYQMKVYPSDKDSDGADGYLHRIMEGKNGTMLIGTERGLLKIDRRTGAMRKINDNVTEHLNVSAMAKDSLGRIWVGGDKGVFMGNASEDGFLKMDFRVADGKYVTDVVDLLIDDRGSLWITTWNSGLFRYDIEKGKLYSFSDSDIRHAYTLATDKEGNLWIGTWGHGLMRASLSSLYSGEPECKHYRHSSRTDSLLDDIIYTISFDSEKNMWVGNRSGLSILQYDGGHFSDTFINLSPQPEYGNLPYNEVNSVLKTKDDCMLVGMFGGGVCKAETPPDADETDNFVMRLESVRREYNTSSVTSFLSGDDDIWWMGISGHGFIKYASSDGSFTGYQDLPEFEGFLYTNNFDAMLLRRGTSEICFGSYDKGVWVYDTETGLTEIINSSTAPAMTNDCIKALAEDSDGNVWIGTREGVFVMSPDKSVRALSGKMRNGNISDLQKKISSISVSPVSGDIWIATSHEGIIRCPKDFSEAMEFYKSNSCQGTGSFNSICADSAGNVWAGSMWDGLFRWNKKDDRFEKVGRFVFLDGHGVTNIAEDPYGRIWVATNNSLVSFVESEDGSLNSISYIDIARNGAMDFFNHNTATYVPEKDCMAFGCFSGIRFFPCRQQRNTTKSGSIDLSDIKIGNRSIVIDDNIVVNHNAPMLDIHFTLFDFHNPAGNVYRYRLSRQGRAALSDDWKIVNGNHNYALFQNLDPGKYVFEVYGTRSGETTDSIGTSIQIHVLGNPWLSWWAIMIYVFVFAGLFVTVILIIRSSYRFRRRIEMEQFEKHKAQEINQAKLQFFTNVSHEFLTPLSIILAGMESLEPKDLKEKNVYTIMSANAVRLMRLVQQVLEFRKAESGNLRLLVSHGNVARFIRHCVESFAPLVRKHCLKITFSSKPKDIDGWFDTDKIDKIAYNLISNAVKYTPDGGHISVEVSLCGDGILEIACSNDGKLMSKKTIEGLFRRFYEGEYRQFKTIGNGIGLSLVKSLVTLHKGTIEVVSNEQVKNRFIVHIPVAKENYSPEEIDESMDVDTRIPLAHSLTETIVKSDRTILFVDDNEDLTELFEGVMSRRFNVLTCNSAQKTLELLDKEHIDIVVSDVFMPDMDGLQLCSKIKETIEFSHIPVILLTAKTGDSYSIEGYRHGADGYLAKPCNYSVLSAMIHNLLDRKTSGGGREFKRKLVFDVKDVDYTSSDQKFLKQAVDIVNGNIADSEFKLPAFASAMAMSITVLTEKMKTLTGFSPMAFIINSRLTLAYRMITENKDHFRVSDIAYSVGFSDAKYFSKRFKAKFGLSPKELIDKSLNNNLPEDRTNDDTSDTASPSPARSN